MMVVDMEPHALAANIREFADQVERGDFAAVAFAICDKDGGGGHGCCVNHHLATPDLIDEMVGTLKKAMWDSYGDE